MNPQKFYPGLPLRAKHLIDFEQYLLSRQNLISPDHGVIKAHMPVFERNILQIKEVAGITPSGTPVWVTPPQQPVFLDFNLNHNAVMIDLYMVNNNERNEGDAEELGRFRLTYLTIVELDNLPVCREDALYLGRYVLNYNTCELIEPPYFYNLYAAYLFFGKQKWSDWTEPIRKQLRTLNDNNPENALIHYKISELIFSYTEWPLNRLFKKCSEISVTGQKTTAKELLDDTFMTEFLTSQVEIKQFSYPPHKLPERVTDCLKVDQPYIQFLLLEPKEYEIKANSIIAKRKLKGNYEIKIQFPEKVPTTYVNINGHPYVSRPVEEKNVVGVKCWSYIVRYDKAETKPLDAPWTIEINNLKKPFLIYYKSIVIEQKPVPTEQI